MKAAREMGGEGIMLRAGSRLCVCLSLWLAASLVYADVWDQGTPNVSVR
jgi:hypothetical protein